MTEKTVIVCNACDMEITGTEYIRISRNIWMGTTTIKIPAWLDNDNQFSFCSPACLLAFLEKLKEQK